jgi:hypothetical protein
MAVPMAVAGYVQLPRHAEVLERCAWEKTDSKTV